MSFTALQAPSERRFTNKATRWFQLFAKHSQLNIGWDEHKHQMETGRWQEGSNSGMLRTATSNWRGPNSGHEFRSKWRHIIHIVNIFAIQINCELRNSVFANLFGEVTVAVRHFHRAATEKCFVSWISNRFMNQ